MTIMQDGDQDGCHDNDIRGILLLKHIQLLHISSVLCLKCTFLVVHIIVKSFGFSYDPTSNKRRKMTTKIAAIIMI